MLAARLHGCMAASLCQQRAGISWKGLGLAVYVVCLSACCLYLLAWFIATLSTCMPCNSQHQSSCELALHSGASFCSVQVESSTGQVVILGYGDVKGRILSGAGVPVRRTAASVGSRRHTTCCVAYRLFSIDCVVQLPCRSSTAALRFALVQTLELPLTRA